MVFAATTWDAADFDRHIFRLSGTLTRVDGTLIVQSPKTARSRRSIPMTAAVKELLSNVRLVQDEDRLRAGSPWQESGLVFTTALGTPVEPSNALRALKSVVERHNNACEDSMRPDDRLLGSIGLHTLRHSAASAMLQANVPLPTVSEVLGHGSALVTATVYSHVLPSKLSEALETLGTVMENG